MATPCSQCDFRSHQDFTKPASCKITRLHCDNVELPLISGEACSYCLSKNPLKTPNSEPFRSVYLKMLAAGETPTIPLISEHLKCSMRGPLQGSLDSTNSCMVFGSCSLTPKKINLQACQLCPRYFTTNYQKMVQLESPPVIKPISSWMVGVITAPRTHSTLKWSLNTIKGAGWDRGIIFNDSADCPINDPNWPVVARHSKLGLFRNFILGLYELFLRDTKADAYLIIQDDMLCIENLRSYLEKTLWFDSKPHIISPFAPYNVNHTAYPNIHGDWRSTDMYTAGPNSLVLSNETTRAILSDMDDVIGYHEEAVARGDSFEDLGIYHWANRHGYKTYWPIHGLIDHIGLHSTHRPHQHERWMWNHSIAGSIATHNVEFITNSHTVSDSEWELSTTIPDGYAPITDLNAILKRAFNYEECVMVFATGYDQDRRIIYNEDSPVKTICRKRGNYNPLPIRILDHECYWEL